jgi:hypothetical protein
LRRHAWAADTRVLVSTSCKQGRPCRAFDIRIGESPCVVQKVPSSHRHCLQFQLCPGRYGIAEQDAYALVNLMASYEIDRNWTVSANLNNLTDEKYLSSLYWTQAYYGAPRNASMTVSWNY